MKINTGHNHGRNQKLVKINGTSEAEIFSRIVLQAHRGSQVGLTYQEFINNCTWYMPDFQCTVLFIRVQGANEKMTKHPLLDSCYLLSIVFDPGIYDPRMCTRIEKGLFAQHSNKTVHNVHYNKEKGQYFYNSRLFIDKATFQPIEFNEEILNEFLELKWKTKNQRP